MNKPKKFSNYIAALLDGIYEYPSLAEDMFRTSYGMELNEVDECREYLDYVVEHDMVERKICVMKGIKRGPIYDVFQCTNCEIVKDDLKEPIQFKEVPDFMRYCPLCGAKIVEVQE